MSTVIFGGSFDPLHMGHVSVVKEIFNSIPNIDKLYIIPAGAHPEDKQYLFTDEQRLLMLEAVFGIKGGFYREGIVISDIEILNKHAKSYTADTVAKLHAADIVVGADQAAAFSSWSRPHDIARSANLWYFPREGFTPDPAFEWNVLNAELQNISSTYIRERMLKKDFSIHNYIPDAVNELARKFLS